MGGDLRLSTSNIFNLPSRNSFKGIPKKTQGKGISRLHVAAQRSGKTLGLCKSEINLKSWSPEEDGGSY